MKTHSIAAGAVAALSCLTLSACFNLATQPTQITGSYVSPQKYAAYDCSQLLVERDSLARQETILENAQTERRKSSKVQAFWLGFGQGDGIEASELADARGNQEAVRKEEQAKSCHA